MNTNTHIRFIKELSILKECDIESKFISILKSKNILKYDIKNKNYYFNYVGLIELGNGNFLSILPKCIPQEIIDNNINLCEKYTKNILKAIEKYTKSNSEEIFSNLENKGIEDDYNLFTLYNFLINDYLDYGFYSENSEIYEKDGNNEIDWDYTLNYENSYLNEKKKPLYLNYYSLTSKNKDYSLIQEIHKFFLNKASNYFKKIYFILPKPILNFYSKIEEHHINEKIIYMLEKLLSKTFNQRKIRLLKVFILLLNKETHSQSKEINLYGIRYFHILWEDICKIVFNDLYSNSTSYKNIMKKFTKPKYFFYDNSKNKLNTKPMIPDVVTRYKDTFIIIDAKYYNISIQNSDADENNIDIINEESSFLPGTYDVLKQFIYMETFLKDETLEINLKKAKNVFIIPSTKDIHLGRVEMGLYSEKYIDIYFMEMDKALELYLMNQLNIKLLDKIVKETIF